VARALIADPEGVGWRAYKSVYPNCPRHGAENGYTRLSKDPDFAARIDDLKAAAAEGAVASARQVLEELTRIGLANLADYIGPGFEMREISEMSRDKTAALAEVTVETFMSGRVDDAREVRSAKFKLADKRAALVDLGRHHKLFTDKAELTGIDGAPLTPAVPVINLFGHPGPTREDNIYEYRRSQNSSTPNEIGVSLRGALYSSRRQCVRPLRWRMTPTTCRLPVCSSAA
jgi:phage terminase small subunit